MQPVDGNFWSILLVLQDHSRKLERNAVLWKNQFVASVQMLIKMFVGIYPVLCDTESQNGRSWKGPLWVI